jgi:hypothetical protein
MPVELLLHDLNLLVSVWIAEGRLHEEAVELRLWQREGSLVLDGVLRCHDEERVWLRGSVDLEGGVLDLRVLLH